MTVIEGMIATPMTHGSRAQGAGNPRDRRQAAPRSSSDTTVASAMVAVARLVTTSAGLSTTARIGGQGETGGDGDRRGGAAGSGKTRFPPAEQGVEAHQGDGKSERPHLEYQGWLVTGDKDRGALRDPQTAPEQGGSGSHPDRATRPGQTTARAVSPPQQVGSSPYDALPADE